MYRRLNHGGAAQVKMAEPARLQKAEHRVSSEAIQYRAQPATSLLQMTLQVACDPFPLDLLAVHRTYTGSWSLLHQPLSMAELVSRRVTEAGGL